MRLNHCMFFGLLALLFVPPTTCSASIISYGIDVTVTSASNAPGLETPWSFGSLPTTFHGTFDADDSVPGNISNLQLMIGGVDIAATHPTALLFPFNPATLELRFTLLKLNSSFVVQSGLFFGDFTAAAPNAPTNYVLAFDNSTTGPDDPFYGSKYNWSGTFTVIDPRHSAVPEPSTGVILLIGVSGLALARRSKMMVD